MGNQPGVETIATSVQIERFKNDFNTTYTSFVDKKSFYHLMGDNLPSYIGRSVLMTQNFNSNTLKQLGACTEENQLQWKAFIRQGVPDKQKRKVILQYFQISEIQAEQQYETLGSLSDREFKKLTSKSRVAQQKLKLDCLTEEGKSELEFILKVITKQYEVQSAYILVHIAGLLLLYLKPCEVYAVCECLIIRSREIFKKGKQDALRWHITLDHQAYVQTISTFMQAYIQVGILRKRQSLTRHCQKVQFDFTRLVDNGFRNFMTNYLNFSNMTDFMMVFLSEGQKSLTRYTYSILKLYKDFILSKTDLTSVIDIASSLEKQALRNTKTNELHYFAFKMNLKTASAYKFSEQKTENLHMDIKTAHQSCQLMNNLPTQPIESEIITYEQLAFLWLFLPEIMRLRIPQVVYQSSTDGYALSIVYTKCAPYAESYSACIILVEAEDGAIFGALVDTMPVCSNKFQGSGDSFVFTLHPEVNKYNFANKNDQVALFAMDYFLVGMGDKGPALRIDEQLKIGRSYASETFLNDPLTQKQGILGNDFKIVKFEILKL